MKTFRRSLLFAGFALLATASLIMAASTPSISVVISNSAGKIVYKGTTDAKGIFATPDLAAGDYVVQFNAQSSLNGGPFALVVGAGKRKVVAQSVPAEKFSKGVVMKVTLDRHMNLTGQMAVAGVTTPGAKSDSKVKYINGKKYVWVPGELGSNLGGRWVEEGDPAAQNVLNAAPEALRDLQSRSQR